MYEVLSATYLWYKLRLNSETSRLVLFPVMNENQQKTYIRSFKVKRINLTLRQVPNIKTILVNKHFSSGDTRMNCVTCSEGQSFGFFKVCHQ